MKLPFKPTRMFINKEHLIKVKVKPKVSKSAGEDKLPYRI